MDYGELLQDGGVFARNRAITLGVPLPELNRMLRVGTLKVIRPGWYAIASSDPTVHRAVKAGGVLSCISALARYEGVWIPPGDALHVRRSGYCRRSVVVPKTGVGVPVVGRIRPRDEQAENAAGAAGKVGAENVDVDQIAGGRKRAGKARRRKGRVQKAGLGTAPTKRGCCAYRALPAPKRAVDSLLDALACAARCVSQEYLVAILDSVLHHRLATMAELEATLKDAPPRVLALLGELDEKAGSGTESLVRFRLSRLGIDVRTQKYFDGVGWVDLLVGDRMIIECDSKSHHLGEQYHNDRSRDLISMAEGRITVRLTYESVLFDWATVEPLLLELIRRRAHRSRVKNRHKKSATRDCDGRQTA